VDDKATIQTKSRYNRIAPLYDLMEVMVERFAFRWWRERLWSKIHGNRILEVGVGTGKNLSHYPSGAQVTAVDLSDKMLVRARRRAQELDIEVDLCLIGGDIRMKTYGPIAPSLRCLRQLSRLLLLSHYILSSYLPRRRHPIRGMTPFTLRSSITVPPPR